MATNAISRGSASSDGAPGPPVRFPYSPPLDTQEEMLFGRKPNDPVTLGTALLSLSVVSTLASLLPAAPASRHDPMMALRNE